MAVERNSNVSWQFSRFADMKNGEVVLVERPAQQNRVAIVGAGPAGIFAAKQLLQAGVGVAVINRDIKPGGLAEYGIYPDKYRMKSGLRNQFQQVLDQEDFTYFGNVSIGQEGDLTLGDLCAMGFQAVLVTVGAQGTKWLGFPGEDLNGVYHAKDIVYHYNHLPPYSEREFMIGKRVAVVGVGNVMLDIAHWLIKEKHVEEVIAIARRGPAEVKFTRTELEYVVGNLDIPAYQAEIERVSPLMRSLGQDPNKPLELVQAALQRAAVTGSDSRFQLRFLGSPVKILGDSHQRVVGLEIENTTLVENGGEIRAKGLGVFQTLMVDNVIFAIGDRVDATFGLPVKGNEFVKNPNPRFPVEDISYEVFDPETNQPLERIFVAGWARQASTGLVGLAKKDGVNGARAILQYLETQPDGNPSALQLLESRMAGLNKPVVCKEDLARLAVVEQQKAARNGLEEFKFASNHEMLEAMGMAVLHG